MRRCFFIGHREAGSEILPQLERIIEQHIIEYEVEEFIVGSYGHFDRLVHHALESAKNRHPHIILTLLLPYHPGEKSVVLPDGFDGSYYPDGIERVPRRYAIVRANKAVLNECEYLIAYVWHPASNSLNIVEYAEKRGIHISYIKRNTTL